MIPPNCECHDVEMLWQKCPDRKGVKGRWYCREKHRQRANAYYWADPIKCARKIEEADRRNRIPRMEQELKELLNAP